MRKFFLFSCILLVSFSWNRVEAHVLKAENHIGVVMHIDPDDDPIAGQVSTFYFDFKDPENEFDAGKCDCTFHVISEGKEINTQHIFNVIKDGSNSSTVQYTFPKKGDYTVKLTGVPVGDAKFESFEISLDWSVRREESPKIPKQDHTVHYILIGLGALIAVAMILYDFFQNRDYYKKKFSLGESGQK